MTGNSLEGLLAWLQDRSQLQEWDALLVLSAARVNQGLQEEYDARRSRGQSWQPPALQVPIPDTPFTHYLDGLSVGAPAFTLERASLDSAEVQLRLPVLGGSDMLVAARFGERNIERLSSWDPLFSPQLHLALRPEGSVDAQGHLQLSLDPAQAEAVELEFSGTNVEKREIGKGFLDWFKGLAPAQRSWPVLQLGETANPMLRGAGLKLRSQANPAAGRLASDTDTEPDSDASATISSNAEGDREGALLLFIGMEHGQQGGIPGDNSGFKYLLPDDQGPDYSATALFAIPLLHRAALSVGAQGLLEQGRFAYEPASGLARRMVASAGSLQVPATQLSSDDLEFECEPFVVQAGAGDQALAVAFEAIGARQTWQFSRAVPLRYRVKGAADWQEHTATFKFKIEFEFHLAAQADARLGMRGHLFAPRSLAEEAVHVSGLPSLPAGHLEQLQGLLAMTLKRAVLARYSESLRIDACDALLGRSPVAGVLALEPRVQALPYDQALFGRLSDSRNPWRIVERQRVISAGSTLQLSVEPAQSGLLWSVQNLPGGGGHPGSINSNGLYTAPPAHELGGPNRTLLVTASDPASGAWHFTLVTVTGRALSVDPLIQVCGPGDPVQLAARLAGTGTLQWSMADNSRLRPGEQGRTCTYTAPGPGGEQAYALEQVQVSDASGSRRESLWMLVRFTEPAATIRLDPDSEPGTVQLRFFISDAEREAEWRLEANSPGSIDPDGLYHVDPSAAQPFALIFAKGSRLGRVVEQHIILPLPLEQFPSTLQALAQR